MPRWDALDSEFNADAKNVFDYLKEGYKACLDAYINTLDESERKNVKNGLINLRNILQTIANPILDNLSPKEHNAYVQLKTLENRVGKWDKEKEKIKKLLWWDDVAKGLAKQNNTNVMSKNLANKSSNKVKTKSQATLEPKGQIWSINPLQFFVFGVNRIEDGITFDVIRNNIKEKYTISHESYDKLILSYEGYSKTPYVPKGNTSSGITLGYGYDLGYQNANIITKEISGLYSSEQIERLKKVLGKRGNEARNSLSTVADISISQENARRLSIISKKRYAQQVVNIYPESIELSTDQKGALLSLVYNRGSLLEKPDGSRREMKEIQTKLRNNELKDIPGLFRSMKRLWEGKNLDGLVKRREDEAKFFEKGL